MATDLFFRTGATALWGGTQSDQRFSVKDTSRGVQPGATLFEGTGNAGTRIRSLSPTVGTGVGTTISPATVAGTTLGLMTSETLPTFWITDPFAADVTISGTVSFAFWALETSMNANATVRCALYRVDAEGALTLIIDASFGTELGTTNALKSWSGSPTSTACKKGDRLLALPLIDDATALTMATGFNVTVAYDGANANSADTKITLTETVTFLSSDPAGTTYYLRATTSDISTGKVLSTTQGSGTVDATHTTIAGPLTFPGDQWTATAGGSDIEWFTPALDAFTLGGIVQAIFDNAGTALENSSSPTDCLTLEVAVVDADGTNPVIWARSYTSHITTTGARSFYLSGADLSVGQGKRLRFRPFSDDMRPTGNQVSGTNRVIRYDGTSTYAARLIFTQTITEAAAGTTASPGVGALTLAGLVPTILLPQLVSTALGLLVATGLAPTAKVDRAIAIGLGQVAASGLAPVVTTTNNVTISTGLGAATLTGFAPSLDFRINLATGALTATGFAPTVTTGAGVIALPGLGALTATGLAPSLDFGIRTGLGALTATGFAPTVLTPRVVTPGVGAATLSGLAPSLDFRINLGAGALTLTGLAPTAIGGVSPFPGVGVLTATGLAPTVTATQNKTVLPGVGAATLSGFVPTVLTPRVVTPGVGAATLTGLVPTILTPRLVTPGVGAVAAAGLAPTVTATQNKFVFPGVGALAASGLAPSVQLPVVALPGVGAVLLTGLAPTVGVPPPPPIIILPSNIQMAGSTVTGLVLSASPHVTGVALLTPEVTAVEWEGTP
jgi:hypothetical protein